MRDLREVQAAELHALVRRRAARLQRFVRRAAVRDHEKAVRTKLLRGGDRAVQMSSVGRIEAAPVKSDLHFFALTSSIFGSDSLRL